MWCAGNADPATTNGVDNSDDELAAPISKSTQLTAEQGLKHLLLTVDVERLYRSMAPAVSCLQRLVLQNSHIFPAAGMKHCFSCQADSLRVFEVFCAAGNDKFCLFLLVFMCTIPSDPVTSLVNRFFEPSEHHNALLVSCCSDVVSRILQTKQCPISALLAAFVHTWISSAAAVCAMSQPFSVLLQAAN